MNAPRFGKPLAPAVATILPPPARLSLVAAADIDPNLPVGASPQRTRALESAIERVKRQYPHYLKEQTA